MATVQHSVARVATAEFTKCDGCRRARKRFRPSIFDMVKIFIKYKMLCGTKREFKAGADSSAIRSGSVPSLEFAAVRLGFSSLVETKF
jgi:hypothetical protein